MMHHLIFDLAVAFLLGFALGSAALVVADTPVPCRMEVIYG